LCGVCSLVALVGCENDLTDFLFKNLFYEGWKVSSWSEAVPVVEGETHLLGDEKSNGFPMNMVMGSNGKIHLIGFRVSATPREWVYTTREPGADGFEQLFTVVSSDPANPDSIAIMPGMDLISDDVPFIAYGQNKILYFQQYSAVSGWGTKEDLYIAGIDIPHAFVFFFTSDLKPHLFYVTDDLKMYHTVRTGFKTINPATPEVFIDDCQFVCAQRVGGNDVAFVYTDSTYQNLYCRTFSSASASAIWSVPDPSLSIGTTASALDSNGNLHVICGTFKTDDMLNPAYFTLHYFVNSGGTWEKRESIEGTAASGPYPLVVPPSIDIAPDKHGNDRLHMAYTNYIPPWNHPIWYAFYDEVEGWQIAPESVDTAYTNSFWTFPLIAVDPEGIVHIVYSWTQTEFGRTMMYVRGTPEELQ
jgi:hypothetical protein